MVTEVLFVIAKNWKFPKYPSTGEWINDLWYIYAMEYYSAIKRNEQMIYTSTWLSQNNYTE